MPMAGDTGSSMYGQMAAEMTVVYNVSKAAGDGFMDFKYPLVDQECSRPEA